MSLKLSWTQSWFELRRQDMCIFTHRQQVGLLQIKNGKDWNVYLAMPPFNPSEVMPQAPTPNTAFGTREGSCYIPVESAKTVAVLHVNWLFCQPAKWHKTSVLCSTGEENYISVTQVLNSMSDVSGYLTGFHKIRFAICPAFYLVFISFYVQ